MRSISCYFTHLTNLKCGLLQQKYWWYLRAYCYKYRSNINQYVIGVNIRNRFSASVLHRKCFDRQLQNSLQNISDALKWGPPGQTGFRIIDFRVKLAAQVLSHSVAVGINTLCTFKKLDEESKYTAKFIENFDQLVNAFNNSTVRSAQNMGHAI